MPCHIARPYSVGAAQFVGLMATWVKRSWVLKWLWVKKKTPRDRFWSIFPFTNCFFWIPGLFDPQPGRGYVVMAWLWGLAQRDGSNHRC